MLPTSPQPSPLLLLSFIFPSPFPLISVSTLQSFHLLLLVFPFISISAALPSTFASVTLRCIPDSSPYISVLTTLSALISSPPCHLLISLPSFSTQPVSSHPSFTCVFYLYPLLKFCISLVTTSPYVLLTVMSFPPSLGSSRCFTVALGITGEGRPRACVCVLLHVDKYV